MLMRMALAAFRSASDRHFVRSRHSALSYATISDRSFLLCLHTKKQDHSFATRTKQRTLVRLFGLHASCILVSKSDRNCTVLFTGFASVAPVRIETSTRELFASEISQHCKTVSSCVCRRCHRHRSHRVSQRSGRVLVSNVPHKETQALVLQSLVLDPNDH